MILRALAVMLAFLLAGPWTAAADVFRPAYLELRQTGPAAYDVLWKQQGAGIDAPLSLHLVLPPGVKPDGPVHRGAAAGHVLERFRLTWPGGLDGLTLTILSRSGQDTDILVRHERLDGSAQVARLSGAAPQFRISDAPAGFEVARTYLVLGFQHILEGADHLLFVAALVLLVGDLRRLVAAVTAFTVAHSITLSLATLGVIHVPSPPVEALIALSIVFVAVEIRRRDLGRSVLAIRAPWTVAFAFGLLHGLGIAGALSEIGLPPGAIPLALLCFNLGVEAGQLLFIVVVLISMRLLNWLAKPSGFQDALRHCLTTTIGTLSAFWVFERFSALI